VGEGEEPSEEYVDGESIDLENGARLFFSRTVTRLPLVEFRLTDGDVCVDKRDFYLEENRELYKLQNEPHFGCTHTVGE